MFFYLLILWALDWTDDKLSSFQSRQPHANIDEVL